jgi:hypothetical protein
VEPSYKKHTAVSTRNRGNESVSTENIDYAALLPENMYTKKDGSTWKEMNRRKRREYSIYTV